MFNKWKDQLNEKFKKKNANANADDGADAASDTVSNSSVPHSNTPAQQVAFSLSNMDEFSHEELQMVIQKYDAGLQKLKSSITEKNDKISTLEAQMAKTGQEMEENKMMADMQAEENKTLK